MARTFLAIVASLLVSLTTLSGGPESARAFEYWDGRIQVHGFYEKQLRTLSNDFSFADDIDVAQWWNVLNVEIEAELLPFGAGPITYMSAFARVEARFDCVWSNLCSIGNGAPAWGDRAEHLPKRLASGRLDGLTGAIFTGDTRPRHVIPIEDLGFENKDKPVGDSRQPAFLFNIPGLSTLFGGEGVDQELGTFDDPAQFVFADFVKPGSEFRFATRQIKGPLNGTATQVLGPWLPQNEIDPIGALANIPNPFNPDDFNPILSETDSPFGSTELPFRPAPNFMASEKAPGGNSEIARGLFIPNSEVAELIRRGEFDSFDQNFRESELQFNRGGSQQDEKELKELYLDIEALNGKLWLRIGKQNIVWGKTELFRTTDQFNPQDIALASLPTLEESRIALWSARAVWSFGNVGPAEDVRLEVAANLDDFEPTDLGACGEAFTPNPVCNISAGLFAHSLAGIGLAGRRNAPDWWNDGHGLEYGARLEWRMGIFSFALIDFYGFQDTPHVQQIFSFERNVDPRTGRLRRNNSRLGCDPEGLFDGDTRGCLGPGDDALRNQAANQQLFGLICASSIGFTTLDPGVCAFSVFGSKNLAAGLAPVSAALTNAMSGRANALDLLFNQLAFPGEPGPNPLPFVPLSRDAGDGPKAPPNAEVPEFDTFTGNSPIIKFGLGIAPFLTDEQEALLGCGRFFQTECDIDGVDLLNAEASALVQSWPGVPGTFSLTGWDLTDPNRIQPGTVGFEGLAVCTRADRNEKLPGCRGPGDPGFDPAIDGMPVFRDKTMEPFDDPGDADFVKDPVPFFNNTVLAELRNRGFSTCPDVAVGDRLIHPFTCQPFQNEMAVVSFNLLMVLTSLSGPLGVTEADAPREINEFKPSEPFREDGCSFVRVELCDVVQGFFSVLGVTRSTARAGGNNRFGRVDFSWHSGGTGVLRFEKRNVLGFSMDFVHDPSKTSWSFEATWINDVLMADNDEFDGLTEVDTYNLTISMDRPTFVNFLNANRTFFINTQWFFQQVAGFRESFTSNGPFNALMTFTVNTGFFQDRLLPQITFVYDFGSNSGAMLHAITYRYTENFSASVGVNIFAGRFEKKPRPINGIGTDPFGAGRHKDSTFVENGLAAVRDRDEIFMRIRYTF